MSNVLDTAGNRVSSSGPALGAATVVLTVALLLSLVPVPSSGSEAGGSGERSGSILVDPVHSDVLELERFWVDVLVDSNVAGLTGYDLVIDFDESLLSVEAVQEGSLPSGYSGETFFYWTTDGAPSQSLVVNGALLGGSVDGPGSLLHIEFEALAPGTSPLSFESVQLRDIENAPIPVTAFDGQVRVAAQGRIYIDPGYASAWEGDTLCVDVAIDSVVQGLTGFNLLIDFNEGTLGVNSVEKAGLMIAYEDAGGSAYLNWSDEGQPSDALLIDGAFLGGSVDGPGSLVTLCFVGVSAGLTAVEFTLVDLRDLDNNEIPAIPIPGEIEIVAEPSVVQPATWTTIKGIFR